MRLRITLAFALLAASIGMLLYSFGASENYTIHNYSLVVCCLLPVGSPWVALAGLWILNREWKLRRARIARVPNDPPGGEER
ncbi:MAG: hypothetical protein IPG17_12380 [Sandaracinaceae bacterium]|nr:hypothetical protein [Sandaracinaceae bacterium]MBP7682869.1 hypothetical protein [Deltaproteobacteria bacterium]MBK6809126.1 hypothetical protein [Sandaracinaceae bacterium]MBK7153551.1 hypothetical protein [Sandaracinaceae bacterium]MBK7772538.1 hypothetical protein [Sandaracinaceae bacterium]